MIQDNIRRAANILSVKGSFKIQNGCTYIVVTSVHKEVLETFYRHFGGYIRENKRPQPRKNLYIWRLYGNAAVGLMMSMYDLLPIRRQKEIKKCINIWKEAAKPTNESYSNFSENIWAAWAQHLNFKGTKEMFEHLLNKYPQVDIAEILGISQTTVSIKIKQLNIKYIKKHSSLPEIKIEGLRRRYRLYDGNVSWSELGKQLGVTSATAKKYIERRF